MPGYRTESTALKHANEIKQQWLDLQTRADYSYFQSWGWISTWLDQIAIELQPIVVRVWLDDRLVGISLFVSKRVKRRGVFSSHALYLNEYPFDGQNMVIEYNGLLAEKMHEKPAYIETTNHLLKKFKTHDEFCFGALLDDVSVFDSKLVLCEPVNHIIKEDSITRFVDLSSIQPGIESYLASLSRNRRGQIRRSIRLYEEAGELKIEKAETVEDALLYFDQLKILHSSYWQSKGQAGSFTNPNWEKFHRALISSRFDKAEVQMLKVSSAESAIGYIYNVILDKHVYVIQTGFACSDDKRMMPGYVAHTLAISYNRSNEMKVYDLMHGDSLYKQILCTGNRKLIWHVIQRKRLKFFVENVAVNLIRNFR